MHDLHDISKANVFIKQDGQKDGRTKTHYDIDLHASHTGCKIMNLLIKVIEMREGGIKMLCVEDAVYVNLY